MLKTESWPIERLVPYARNPRKNDEQVERMVAAIREFGFRIPVVAKSDGTVVDGHLRLKAARKLGLMEVPVALADELTDAQVKAFRLLANRSANWAAWEGQVEWVQVARQSRVAEFETATHGYGMLNLGAAYNGKLANGSPWQLYVKGTNLTDRLAYAHTSFIKTAAPLMGRNITVGVKVAF